jgi:hypothetical protein
VLRGIIFVLVDMSMAYAALVYGFGLHLVNWWAFIILGIASRATWAIWHRYASIKDLEGMGYRLPGG